MVPLVEVEEGHISTQGGGVSRAAGGPHKGGEGHVLAKHLWRRGEVGTAEDEVERGSDGSPLQSALHWLSSFRRLRLQDTPSYGLIKDS